MGGGWLGDDNENGPAGRPAVIPRLFRGLTSGRSAPGGRAAPMARVQAIGRPRGPSGPFKWLPARSHARRPWVRRRFLLGRGCGRDAGCLAVPRAFTLDSRAACSEMQQAKGQQGDEKAPCPEKRSAYVVAGALPQPLHIRIPLWNQGSFIMLLVPSSGALQVLGAGRRSAGPASTARPRWQEWSRSTGAIR